MQRSVSLGCGLARKLCCQRLSSFVSPITQLHSSTSRNLTFVHQQRASISNESKSLEDLVVRFRGLPWSATEDDVRTFLGSIVSGVNEIQLTLDRKGRPSGEAYISFHTEASYYDTLQKNNQYMGNRYIEVFPSNEGAMTHVVSIRGKQHAPTGIVRLKGLPFGCTEEEIQTFLNGLEIIENGIILPKDSNGRSRGFAYVSFVDKETSEKAIEKHMENIGDRYIEVYHSTKEQLEKILQEDEDLG